MKNFALTVFNAMSVLPSARSYAFAFDAHKGFLGCIASSTITTLPQRCVDVFGCEQIVWISRQWEPAQIHHIFDQLTEAAQHTQLQVADVARVPYPIAIVDVLCIHEGHIYSALEGELECPTS